MGKLIHQILSDRVMTHCLITWERQAKAEHNGVTLFLKKEHCNFMYPKCFHEIFPQFWYFHRMTICINSTIPIYILWKFRRIKNMNSPSETMSTHCDYSWQWSSLVAFGVREVIENNSGVKWFLYTYSHINAAHFVTISPGFGWKHDCYRMYVCFASQIRTEVGKSGKRAE